MRLEKAVGLLALARELAGTAEGLTLDEMAATAGVGRRTAERMRDVLELLFPQLDLVDDTLPKRYRIVGGLDGLFQSPTAEELATLATTADSLRAAGHLDRANRMASVEAKLRAAMQPRLRNKLAPDLEALLKAETVAVQAGPRPYEDENLLAQIRQAIKATQTLRFTYQGGSAPGQSRNVTPCGIMFGRANYLVAIEAGVDEPRTWRLDRIENLEILEQTASPPADFKLAEFANASFGIFQGDAEDVVLRVRPDLAEEAERWRFHPNQKLERRRDGSIVIRFHASGMLELAWHLFSWGDGIEIVKPAGLRKIMVEQLRAALKAHSQSPPRQKPAARTTGRKAKARK